MKKSLRATIIVSDVTSQGMILTSIHSLCTQEFQSDHYEIILPDFGNFTKEENSLLIDFERQYPHFRILQTEGNRSRKINTAAGKAKGDLLLFIESHCIVHKNWLAEFAQIFSDENVQASIGRIQTIPTGSSVGQAEEYQRKMVMQRMARLQTDKSYFDFHNSAIRKELFHKLGGLSEDIPILAEFELGARLHQNSIPVAQANITIWHSNDSTLQSYSKVISDQGTDKATLLKRNGKEFIEKYFPQPKLTRHLKIIKILRAPLLITTIIMLNASFALFTMAKILGLRFASNRIFTIFAANSQRYGILRGLR